MAKDAAQELKDAFANFVDTVMAGVAAGGGDEDEEEGDFEPLDRSEVEALKITELRELAVERGIEDKKKADILAALEEGGHFADEDEEDEDEDEEDEEDEDGDEDEDEDEDGELTREDLEEMSLAELRKFAKSEEGGEHSAAEVKGLDQDALIDLILGEDEEGEEDEDEEDEDEEETEELDEDALNAMSLTELKALAKELEVKVKVPASAKTDAKKKKVYVETILNSGDDE